MLDVSAFANDDGKKMIVRERAPSGRALGASAPRRQASRPAGDDPSRSIMRPQTRLSGLGAVPLGAAQGQSAEPCCRCAPARTKSPQILRAPCTPRSRRRAGLQQQLQPSTKGESTMTTKTLTQEDLAQFTGSETWWRHGSYGDAALNSKSGVTELR